jgi:ParB/RepB/Spo0J family partition protein
MAPVVSATAPSATTCELALEQLVPCPHNPRRVVPGDPKVAELAESMLSLGVLQPIVVRRHPNAEVSADAYEILAGERRWHAARRAKLAKIPARVIECSDEQALEITVVENLHREQLHPLEECRGVSTLLRSGRQIDEIATSIGKSGKWVSLRAKIADMDPAWLEAYAKEDHPASKLSVAHLELFARLPREVQGEALKEVKAFVKYDGTPWPVEDVRDRLTHTFLNDLRRAPWDQADPNLVPAAGSCTGCTKRSSCQQTLFQDLKDDAEVRGKKRTTADRCLDRSCWASKHAAFVARAKAEAQAKAGPEAKVVVLSHEPAAADEVSAHEVQPAKRTDPGAVVAVVTTGEKAGQVQYVKPKAYASDETKKACGVAVKRKPGRPKVDAKEKLRTDRRKYVVDRLTKRLEAKDLKRPPLPRIIRLVMLIGLEAEYEIGSEVFRRFTRAEDGDALTEKEIERLWSRAREAASDQTYIGSTDPWLEAMCVVAGLELKDLVAEAERELPDGVALDAKTVTAAKEKPKPPAKKPARTKAKAKAAAR